MSGNAIIGIVLVVLGVLALFFGWNQSQSFVDQAAETLTGRFTESTMIYVFVGAAAIAAGLAFLFLGRRRR